MEDPADTTPTGDGETLIKPPSPGTAAAAPQQGKSGGDGVQKSAIKPVTFVTPPDAGGGRVHPEYAKLAEERLKASTNRIVYLESEVGQLNKRWADEKVKSSLIEQQVVKLNDRVVQANELQGKMKQQQEEMKQKREADCKELVDLRQKQKAALALVKQLQDMVSKQKDDQDALVREKV